jgi:hypothetical protein
VLRDVAAGTWHLGLVYQHWVADSVAVRHVLRRWMERLLLPPARHARSKVRHAHIGYLGLLDTAPGSLTPAQTVLSMVRRHLRYRRARKVVTFGDGDYPVGVVLAEAAGRVPALVEAARRAGAKVNDLFLAAAARACDGRVPTQHRANRPDLALGSIVDLRPLARGALDDRFGLFLGFAEVVCRPDEIRCPRRLVATVANQNKAHRQRGIWPSSVGWLMAALAARPLGQAAPAVPLLSEGDAADGRRLEREPEPDVGRPPPRPARAVPADLPDRPARPGRVLRHHPRRRPAAQPDLPRRPADPRRGRGLADAFLAELVSLCAGVIARCRT